MARTAGITNRPGVIDLTRPAKFPTQEGPKRLVIKNLKTTPQDTLEAFYKKTWADLDAALTATFERQQPSTPLEVLCRGVEALCRRGRGEQLAKHVKHRSKVYLEKELVPLMEKEAGSDNIGALRAVHKYWNQWNEQSVSMPHYYLWAMANPSLDHPAVHLLLPRSIIPPHCERFPPTRRPGHPPI
jgi:cullin-4